MIFLTLIAISGLVLGIVLWTQISRLKFRISALEKLAEQPRPDVETADIQPETPPIQRPVPDTISSVLPASNPWENPVAIDGNVHSKPAGTSLKISPVSEPQATDPFVFNRGNTSAVFQWLKENWFLAIAALSLALAGVFLVQYGVENGILSPFWRVISAAVLGIWLIWLGEFVRRKWGDGFARHSAYLPSTFSGAGLVALFASVLAAHQLYGLIGSEAALIWLVGVSTVAVVLGWYYGPFLVVVGLLGSITAPFLVGGESASPLLFYSFFTMVMVAGLLVDAVKKWAWVSALVLIFSFAAAWLIFTGGAGGVQFLVFALIAMVATVTIPPLSLTPTHDGAMISSVSGWIRQDERELVEFPTRIATGTFIAAGIVGVLVAFADADIVEIWSVFALFGMLFVAATVWFRKAPALSDLAIVPVVLFLLIIVSQATNYGALYAEFRVGLSRLPETAPPMSVTIISVMALGASILAYWRGQNTDRFKLVWSAGAALIAPVTLIAFEIWWHPAQVLGDGRWAAHPIVVAVFMVLFAERVGRVDGADRRRAAIFALAALSLISFALILMLSATALTLAIGVMVLLAVLIDRQLNMPLLSVFVQAGVVFITGRLIVFPGVLWAIDAPLWEVIFAYGGSIVLLSVARVTEHGRGRINTQVVLESAAWLLSTVLVSVLLFKWLDDANGIERHWGISLMALVWLVSMFNQLYRLKIGGPLWWLRIVLAVLFGLLASLQFALLFTLANPLFANSQLVVGPAIFDSLMLAFALPGIVLIAAVGRFSHLPKLLRYGFGILGVGFLASYVGLEIRRAWQGNDLSGHGIMAGELYSYTIAILLTSVVVLFIAFNRRSKFLRQMAMLGIGLTIAKVFLIDMSGLDGLYRVATFLGLGLSLAGLALLHRRMSEQWDMPGVEK